MDNKNPYRVGQIIRTTNSRLLRSKWRLQYAAIKLAGNSHCVIQQLKQPYKRTTLAHKFLEIKKLQLNRGI